MKKSGLLRFETIEGWLINHRPFVYALAGSSVVGLRGEFDFDDIQAIYKWFLKNNKKRSVNHARV